VQMKDSVPSGASCNSSSRIRSRCSTITTDLPQRRTQRLHHLGNVRTHAGAAVALGYVESPSGATDDYVNSGRYEIQVSDRRIAARASLKPMLDPKGIRIRP